MKKACDMPGFVVIPAIDLQGGKCVRLRQGRAEESTTYSDDPVAIAKSWEKSGAHCLHVVDLDGAFQGRPVHADVIERMARAVGIPIEVGGGLRTDDDIKSLLGRGVERVILGTRAWQEPHEFERLVDQFGDHLAVGIDARDGKVQVRGWTETTEDSAASLARRMDGLGVKWIIYTDTARDGMLAGVNARAVGAICAAVDCCVIASGGVSSPDDVKALKSLGRKNLVGAIVGKALYEGQVTLKELQGA